MRHSGTPSLVKTRASSPASRVGSSSAFGAISCGRRKARSRRTVRRFHRATALICLPLQPPATGSDWVLFAPQATLFDDDGHQMVTHFASPTQPAGDPTNPLATWQANDNSSVWATREKSLDSPDGSIPWLLLRVVASTQGKAGGHALTKTTYIQRATPAAACSPQPAAHHRQTPATRTSCRTRRTTSSTGWPRRRTELVAE